MPEDTEFQYVATTVPNSFPKNTRSEAVAALAKYGDWERGEVVPISENCLVEPGPHAVVVGPIHPGNRHYGDRDTLPTKQGDLADVDHVTVARFRNGNREETVESYWEVECPRCWRTHESDDGSEEGRSEAIDAALECCGAEWLPPTDWIEDCDVCGDDHRASHECRSIYMRDVEHPVEGVDCAECEFAGQPTELEGGAGRCPECGTKAVRVQQAVTDGGQEADGVESIEITEKQRERFERIREECDDRELPTPTDQQVMKALLDTWDAVDEGLYSDDDLRADGGSRWTIDLSGLRRSSEDSDDDSEAEAEEVETMPLEGPAWYVETPRTMPDLVFPEDDYRGAFQHATGATVEAAEGDEAESGEDSIRLFDFDGETEVPIADV